MSKRELIEKYAQGGRKIMAIKVYRDVTQVGLRDAKEAVEDFMDRGGWSSEQLIALGETEKAAETAEVTSSSGLRTVEVYVKQKKKIQAIKALIELSGYGLRRAKDVVEEFMQSGTWPAELATPSEPGSRLDLSTVEGFVAAGKKIHAIKELRNKVKGIGLRDAKDAVETYMRDGHWADTDFGGVAPDLPGHGPWPPKGGEPGTPTIIEHRLRGVGNMLKGGSSGLALNALGSIPGADRVDIRHELEIFQRWGRWSTELRTALGLPASDPSSLADTMLPSDAYVSPQEPLQTTRTRQNAQNAQNAQTSNKTPAASGPAEPSLSVAVAELLRTEPEVAEIIAVLAERLGSCRVEQIFDTKKNLFSGYLALCGDTAYFVVKRFGTWEIDGEYSQSEGVEVEVRTSFSRIELRLRVDYLQDTFTELDEASARLVAKRLSA